MEIKWMILLSNFKLIGLEGIPDIKKGDDISEIIINTANRQNIKLKNGDILIIVQKIISKSEGRLVDLKTITPTEFSIRLAKILDKDPHILQEILFETKRIVKMTKNLIIVQMKNGLICANAGIDQSNIPKGFISLLPKNPDKSAMNIRDKIQKKLGINLAVIISDTFGRPWREGQMDVAVGVAGLKPILDYRGFKDVYGYTLKATQVAIADELASAAELVMGKLSKIPVTIIRGYRYPKGKGSIKKLVRSPSRDLFI
jgi:coenzyme F420-0:L-glutamate ligase/coenzyme F420-1:gamma-L-glutamate ligase